MSSEESSVEFSYGESSSELKVKNYGNFSKMKDENHVNATIHNLLFGVYFLFPSFLQTV